MPFYYVALFYLCAGGVVFSLWQIYSRRLNRIVLESENIKEQVNLLSDSIERERRNKLSLQERISRYNSLKVIIEEINRTLTLESISEHLLSIAFSLIAQDKGVGILSLVASQVLV